MFSQTAINRPPQGRARSQHLLPGQLNRSRIATNRLRISLRPNPGRRHHLRASNKFSRKRARSKRLRRLRTNLLQLRRGNRLHRLNVNRRLSPRSARLRLRGSKRKIRLRHQKKRKNHQRTSPNSEFSRLHLAQTKNKTPGQNGVWGFVSHYLFLMKPVNASSGCVNFPKPFI
jgi:hypothetical protein